MNKTPNIADIQQLHQSGCLDEAKLGYLEILENNPQEVVALHMLGVLYAEKGDLALAQNYLEKALVVLPNDSILLLHLANILKAKGEYEKAQQVLVSITKSHPTFAAAFNNLGTVYFAQEKWQEAINAYQAAIKIQANYVDAYYNLGLALNKSNRKKEAFTVFSALMEIAPEHVAGHFQLGLFFMQQNKHEKAIEHFAAIEKKHPFHVETQINLATSYLKLGMLNEAKMHYVKALEITSDDTQLLFNLGVIDMQQGRISEALEYYLRAVKIDPDFYDAHNNLAFLYLTMRRMDEALLHFREALRLQPENTAIRHTIHILTHEKNLSTSPPEYIRSLFDSYADHFDAHLTQSLRYQVPTLVHQVVDETTAEVINQWDILDLGCGTGLCGELFKSRAKSLVGVDLSAKMLAMAEQKKIYDELVEAELVAFLTDKKSRYDLIIAGDVLVYHGDLAAIFLAISNALKPKGLFVFNTEISEKDDYLMTASGRFAHSESYLEKVILQNQFKILQHRVVTLRTQNNEPVMGYLYLLQTH